MQEGVVAGEGRVGRLGRHQCVGGLVPDVEDVEAGEQLGQRGDRVGVRRHQARAGECRSGAVPLGHRCGGCEKREVPRPGAGQVPTTDHVHDVHVLEELDARGLAGDEPGIADDLAPERQGVVRRLGGGVEDRVVQRVHEPHVRVAVAVQDSALAGAGTVDPHLC